MDTGTNPILEHSILGNYALGWELYQSLEQPTPEDQRFAGLCLLYLQKTNDAKQLLLCAINAGCIEANIELSFVYRISNEIDKSEHILEQLDNSKLSDFNLVMLARELGVIHYQLGRLNQAQSSFQLAMDTALNNPSAQKLIPNIVLLFGAILSARGYVSQAKNYFRQALDTPDQTRRSYALANHGLCQTYLGEYEGAQHDLDIALEQAEHVPVIRPVLHYYFGQLARAQGDFAKALYAYKESIQLSEAVGQSETEFYAQIGAISIYTNQELFSEARKHLARARLLANGTKMLAYADLREGALLVRLGQANGLGLLEKAITGFESLQLERETGWARLHLAEAHLRQGYESTAMLFIDAATDVRNALGIGAAITLELRGLPLVLEQILSLQPGSYAYCLCEDWQSLKGQAAPNLQIRTLGCVALTLNGQKVKLNAGLATSIEVITYILSNPDSSLEQIIGNVFAEKLPEAAKRYFHLIRNEIKQHIPGASIPFNDISRTYYFDPGEVQLQWDYLEVSRQISQGGSSNLKRALESYKGEFLVSSESEWVLEKRDTLEWNLLKFGVGMLEESFEKRDFKSCLESAERMLEFTKKSDNLEEGEAVFDYLIRATFALKGPKLGLRELERINKQFTREYGVIPAFLEKLNAKFHKVS
jgi:tetratricopeptide (TPR) repeat protein